jgi:transcriptional regulator with PAS, ATPase and Fis domain
MAHGRVSVVFGAQAGFGAIISHNSSNHSNKSQAFATAMSPKNRLSDQEVIAVLGQVTQWVRLVSRESVEVVYSAMGATPRAELPLLAHSVGFDLQAAQIVSFEELAEMDLDAIVYVPMDVQQPKQVEHLARLSMTQSRIRHVAFATLPKWNHSQLMALRETWEWIDPRVPNKMIAFADELIRSIGGITRKDLEKIELPKTGSVENPDPLIITRSRHMKDLLALSDAVSDTDSTILITGDSGTGKELIAQRIHARCHRRNHALVAVNCGAIPEELLESELFGHVKGAFTGAVNNREGRFQAAEGGTLFLDEIAEMGPNLQVKLLRVLQSRKYEPVGSTKTRAANVRIIAATNKDLEAGVKDGSFREDLFYRLNVIPIHIPGLKERRDDVPLLVEHFIKKFNTEKSRRVTGVTRASLRALVAYDWPGNVRELENLMERMVILKSSGMIDVLDFPEKYRRVSLSEIEYEDLMNGARSLTAGQVFGQAFTTNQASQEGGAIEIGGEGNDMKVTGGFIQRPIEQKAPEQSVSQSLEQAAHSEPMIQEVQGVGSESLTVEQAIRLIADRVVFPNEGLDFNSIVDQFENILILQALEKTGWNRNRAAGLLRLNRTTLVEKLKKKQLMPPLRYDNRILEGNA